MSSGGIFQIITNDGKADKMIMAQQLLQMRIQDITKERKARGFKDVVPTLVDVEKSHILFVNAHFKPFVALGYEYNKVPGNQNVSWSSSATFSIPQYGDFFSDMVINMILASTSATAGVVPALPSQIGATAGAVTTTSSISTQESVVANVFARYTQEYVSKDGTAKLVGAAASNYVRYCEYPGQRIFKKVKFEINGNPLDEYTSEAYMFYQKFMVQPNKQDGWKRLMGQEIAKRAVSDLLTISGSASYDAAASNVLNQAGAAATGLPVSATSSSRRESFILNGAQTPKATQPALELWVPLLFWFNRDSRLAIPSVAIPYGQRYITVELAAQADILFVAPGDLFLRTTIEHFANADGTAAGAASTAVRTYRTMQPVLASGSTIDTTQKITLMDLYVNNIFLAPEVHEIYIKRIGFSLIRVHRLHVEALSSSSGRVLLSQFKWPVEYFFAGIRPDANTAASNTNQYRDWHRFEALTDNVVDINTKVSTRPVTDTTLDTPTIILARGVSESQASVERLTYAQETNTITTVKIEVHGIEFYKSLNLPFYRDYIPWNLGSHDLRTPEDSGAIMISFCLHPGEYQPSGHVNVSRAREFYFEFTSAYITTTNTAKLYCLAKAINFLLVSDGSAVLRYST